MPKNTKETTSTPKKSVEDIKEKKATKKESIKDKKNNIKEATEKVKKVASKKTSTKKEDKNKDTSKTKVATKTAVKKTTKKKPSTTVSKKTIKKKTINQSDIVEYYDLPYRYNKTMVKILAQTPKTLFVYWDISDNDRQNFVSQYGDDFFNNTRPVLLVNNITKNYSFEIEINDFANSWYFNVSDEKCEYIVELGRRSIESKIFLPNDYMYIASSNTAESPNGHILFEENQKIIYFRNIKTHVEYSTDIAKFDLLRYMGKVSNIYDLYHQLYNNEEISDLRNPTFSNPTSIM